MAVTSKRGKVSKTGDSSKRGKVGKMGSSNRGKVGNGSNRGKAT